MSHENHTDHETKHDCKNCGHGDGQPPMCSCNHNPGGECHCPPNECKCDQKHHLVGETQVGHNCCATGGEHDHEPAGHAGHDMHAGHMDHSAHGGHDHSSHAGHAGHDHSHHDPKMFQRQFWFALALTIPTVLYSHTVQMLLGFSMPQFFGSAFIPAIAGTILFFTGGMVFLKTGLDEIKSKQPGMMALIAMALVVAFGYSAFLTIQQLFVPTMMAMDFWWELATLIAIMLLGHWIEMSSIMSAQNALGELAKLLPDTAIRIKGSTEEVVPVSELQVGDLVLVRPGAAIPVDGEVTKGTANVNESMLTGESRLVPKSKGDHVIGGTINGVASASPDSDGIAALTIRVTATGDSTMLAGIMKLVAEAQASKSKTQDLANRAAGWLFYLALGAALVTAVAWIVIGGQAPSTIVERVVTVLIIACPHALGLAIPLVTAITTSAAAKQGVLIRNRVAFELARKADVVLFDKTGTLTTGERGVVGAWLSSSESLGDTDELIALAAGLEVESEHPLAAGIRAEAKRRKVEPLPIKDLMTMPGQGVSGRYENGRVLIGGPVLLNQQNISISAADLLRADHANSAGHTVVFVVVDSVLLGGIELGDTPRETSAEAVQELYELRKRVAILSGDASGVAQALATELKIREVFAEVLPHQKAEIVEKLQADGSVVAMVGDGVNDAPALAKADVGIAIGAGTDVAIESAGIVLISSDPLSVSKAISLSKRSYAKMVQNLWWAAGYNLLAIPMAAGAFESFGLVLSPAIGAVLMSLSTIIVAANAQLLRRNRN